MEEMWMDVISADSNYEISTTGSVRNKKTGKILRGGLSSRRYPSVAIQINGKTKHFLLHRLLLETFVGPCPLGMECRHLDGNRLNYSLDNLKWGTRSENMRDRSRHGGTNQNRKSCNLGQDNPNCKLTDEKVLEIDALISQGIPVIEIAEKFKICTRTVSLIKHRKSWLHLWDKPIILEPYDPSEDISE